jgi:SAM-dependent methyltransferase
MTSPSFPVTESSYLDIQAAVGITKHNGGLSATLELLRLCRVADAPQVLYVGSGIGVGPCVIARRSRARVVAIDISERMLDWTRLRAQEEGLADRIETRQGDVLSLPFEADRFEAVLVESVLAFVEDKARAIQECVRVTKPGGYVGMNETVWLLRPPEAKVLEQATALGAYIVTANEWQRLWAASALVDRTAVVASIGLGDEVLSRIQWVGWRWALRAYGRLFRLLGEHPESRQAIRDQFRAPSGVVKLMGYALVTGRKPA